MTFRRWWYRNVYLHSLGWRMTRRLRKSVFCSRCGSRQRLHLHHINYDGYHPVWGLILPDLISRMETLCARHHAEAHRKG
jgi:hypothetical protein